MNGHVGSSNVGYDGTHGSFGYGARNADGSRILEFTDWLNLSHPSQDGTADGPFYRFSLEVGGAS